MPGSLAEERERMQVVPLKVCAGIDNWRTIHNNKSVFTKTDSDSIKHLH